MSIVYTNGRYLPYHQAHVHVEDRGFQFADGVYEVIYFKNRQLIDRDGHFERLQYSLDNISLNRPMNMQALQHICQQVIKRNRMNNGSIYLQITRGTARRDFPFPKNPKPSVIIIARRTATPTPQKVKKGVKVITVPDQRWARCDIKSIALLPATLAKQAAKEAGAFEAWQVNETGYVTEGSSTNAFIIKNEQIITHPVSNSILKGITRTTLIELAEKAGYTVDERRFTVQEAKEADEAFLSSTTNFILPVVQVDAQIIGNGKPGDISLTLWRHYLKYTNS